MAKQIHQLSSGTVNTSYYVAQDSGTSTTKVTVGQIVNYALTTYQTLIAGATQSVRAAVDSIKTALDSLKTLVGSTTISGTGKSTVCELLGNTSIADIGGGTVSGAISSLSNDLANKSQILIKTFNVPSMTISAGTPGTRAAQVYVDIGVDGYTAIVAVTTHVDDTTIANVITYFGSVAYPNRVFINAYRASGAAGTLNNGRIRVVYIKN